jgi:aspartyl-tRNA(Asn)/glutamyl-tRNA(Gln) amidotransferase subunit B
VWSTGEVTGWLRKNATAPDRIPLTGADLAELVAMIGSGAVSSTAAKDVLDGMMRGEGSAATVAASRDLLQVSDTVALAAAVDEVLAANPDAIERFRAGESKVVGFLVGQVMRSTGGKADPQLVNRLLADRLASSP